MPRARRAVFLGLGATAATWPDWPAAPGVERAAAPATTGGTATGTATYEWEIAPEPITDIAPRWTPTPRHRRRAFRLRLRGRCGREGRQGDRRRENG
ncbi:MAG: hypothetical protein ACLSGS_05575 [Adlercreutzia sp.]